jgi:predicted RNA-binding protein Jag
MTTVLVLPDNQNGRNFRAVSGGRESFGKTVGEALDALAEELELDESGAVVYVQDFRADEFFSAAQQARLADLMRKRRNARDKGESLSVDEQVELEKLIEAELESSVRRTEKVADQLVGAR